MPRNHCNMSVQVGSDVCCLCAASHPQPLQQRHLPVPKPGGGSGVGGDTALPARGADDRCVEHWDIHEQRSNPGFGHDAACHHAEQMIGATSFPLLMC